MLNELIGDQNMLEISFIRNKLNPITQVREGLSM